MINFITSVSFFIIACFALLVLINVFLFFRGKFALHKQYLFVENLTGVASFIFIICFSFSKEVCVFGYCF